MKTYRIAVTLVFEAEDADKAMELCHQAMAMIEEADPDEYKGYRDMMVVEEVPSQADTPAQRD